MYTEDPRHWGRDIKYSVTCENAGTYFPAFAAATPPRLLSRKSALQVRVYRFWREPGCAPCLYGHTGQGGRSVY